MHNRTVKIIEATPLGHDLWESKMLQELLKMEGVQTEFAQVTFGIKSAFLRELVQPPQRFVHICSHGESASLNIGMFAREISLDDLWKAEGGLEGKVLTISACSIGRQADVAEEIYQALGCECLIAPRSIIHFGDSAVFFTMFYYQLYSHRFRNKLRSRDSRNVRRRKVRAAYTAATSATKLKDYIRLYEF